MSHNTFENNVVCPVPPYSKGYEFNAIVKFSCRLRNEAISLYDEVFAESREYWKA